MQQLMRAAGPRGLFATFPQFVSRTYAPAPLWAGSRREPVKWHRISRKDAVTLWHEARRLNQTKRGKGLSGVVGQSALAVLHALLFDFLNFRNGQLDPSYEGLAKKTGLSRATVARALVRLKSLGIINWVRRCTAHVDAGGRFCLEQQRNAYAVLPPMSWRGFVARVAHTILPHEWGAAPPPLPSALEQAVSDTAGQTLQDRVRALAAADDPLAQALAALGKHVLGVSRRD